MTDSDILSFVIALYAYPGVAQISWDHFDDGLSDDGICWGAKLVGDTFIVINRGSVNLHDFECDAFALTTMDHELGPVDAGFFRGMRHQWIEVQQVIGGHPWIVAGHSLGAARSSLLAALGVISGHPPVRYVRFGEPRPGCQPLADILQEVPGASYRTADPGGHDRVTDVPFHLPMWPYVHPQPLTDVPATPVPNDPWGPWRYHHIQLYQSGLGQASPIASLHERYWQSQHVMGTTASREVELLREKVKLLEDALEEARASRSVWE